MADGFGRAVTYLRISVTDRCDLRCRYCMAENMQFLPRSDLLSLEELYLISERLVARGIRKIRLTGGEPLTRRGLPELAARIGALSAHGALAELTMTTNGTLLADYAPALAAAGIRRINVSLDSLDAQRFRHVTRRGDLDRVLAGIAAAKRSGLRVKINMVALKGINEDEIPAMVRWCLAEDCDLTLIETMPLGMVEEDRTDRYLPLDGVRDRLTDEFSLRASAHKTGGPARYFDVPGSGTRLGFITPMSSNFCEGCNRIRLTADGRLTMCLGHEDHVDLRSAYRERGLAGLDERIDVALATKPLKHLFRIEQGAGPALARYMSATGG